MTVVLLNAAAAVIATTTTDQDGRYEFSGVTDGAYTVWVADGDAVLPSFAPTVDADGIDTPHRSQVIVATGDDFAQDFGYAPPGHGSNDNLIGDTLFLDVDGFGGQGEGDPGVAGVAIELYTHGGALVGRSITDENGKYVFAALPDGIYAVRVLTTTLPGDGALWINTFDPDLSTPHELLVLVTGGAIELLQDFGYRPAQPAGTIWADSNANGTLDEAAAPGLAGVTVVLRGAAGNRVGRAVTDEEGVFSFSGLPSGAYVVDVVDAANVLDGYWLSDGPNDGADHNSQPEPYAVSAAAGEINETADFGYAIAPGRVGDRVWWDRDGDGVHTPSEPGIGGVVINLIVAYPDGTTVTAPTRTQRDGVYAFDVLRDEHHDGVTVSPHYTVTLAVPPGLSLTHDGTPDAADAGTGTDDNADDPSGERAYPIQGEFGATNDFGFAGVADLGDLPDIGPGSGPGDYATLLVDGAAHLLSMASATHGGDGAQPAFWLGDAVDDEADGQPQPSALGDGLDEDGVSVLATGDLTSGAPLTLHLHLASMAPVEVDWAVWLDWNGNGAFSDAGEFHTGTVIVTATTVVTVAVDASSIYPSGQPVNMRVRLFGAGVPVTVDAYGGTVVNGEVEDYALHFEPTGVVLQRFSHQTGRRVDWRAAVAIGSMGLVLSGWACSAHRHRARRTA